MLLSSMFHKKDLENHEERKSNTIRKTGKVLTQFNEINYGKVPVASWDRKGT